MTEEAELEEIRRKKLLELQRALLERQRAEQLEVQKQAMLRSILTAQARQRLANIKLVRPEFATQLELQLIRLAQAGQIRVPITDTQLKQILAKIQAGRREIRIRRL